MKKLLLACTLLLGSTSVLAQGFNYTFLEGSYLQGEVEDIDADGFSLGGSLAFSDNLHGIVSYSSVEPDGFGRFDVNTTSLGLGFNTTVSNGVDLVLSASWVQGEVDVGRFGNYDEDGIGLRAGFRSWLADGLELNGGIEYVDYGGAWGSDTGIGVGLIYNLTSTFAIGVSGSLSDDPDTSVLGLNARFYLGQ